jgi:acetate kinase
LQCRQYLVEIQAVQHGEDRYTFTGGIGGNSVIVRKKIFSSLADLGLELDEAAHAGGGKERIISTRSSRVKVCIIPANEEVGIALDILIISHCRAIINDSLPKPNWGSRKNR